MKAKNIYILSGIVLIIAAFFSVGYHHIDEHIQILEFAGLKLNKTVAENLPWEYHYQMRQAIQPAIVVLFYNFFNLIGISNPFTIAFFLRLVAAAIAFTGMLMIYKSYIQTITDEKLKKWFLLLSFFLWFMIYNNIRFSSENLSGSVFLIAFSLLISKKSQSTLFYLFVGLLLGLSFLFRYQSGLLIAGLILWYVFMNKNIRIAALLLFAIIIMTGIGIIIDRWYYGNWTFTLLNYFQQNIVLHKASNYGTEPWWFYFRDVFIRAIPPFSIIILASFFMVFVFKRKDLLSWTLFPFLLAHIFIAHKETRFLFPIIGFIPIVIIHSIMIAQGRWKTLSLNNKVIKSFARLFWIVNLVALTVIVFKPANSQIPLFNKIYSGYDQPTVIYCYHDNPFEHINFYKRPNLEIVNVDSLENIKVPLNKKQLIATSDTTILSKINAHKKLVYSTIPKWFFNFNFNNWISRTSIWWVYELY